MNLTQLLQKDQQYIWHPGTQMKDLAETPPLVVHEAKGSYLYTDRGPIIDALSSWWCKSLGHRHPAVIDAIQAQLGRFEHVIGANTTHPTLVQLGEKLAQMTGNPHVFFASDGSSAVEIAMKLALHAAQLKGEPQRREWIALQNGYHGETFGALTVSDLSLYKKPYQSLEAPCHFLRDLPYLNTVTDPAWSNIDDQWLQLLQQLEPFKSTACALILEPIIQGAGGMRCYGPALLEKLATWTQQNGIYLIADEIMTGCGRTGKWLASDHAGITADLICLSKGLTSGTLPLSCVSVSQSLYDLFYDDYLTGKSFLHSHTYSGHALAAAAAVATLDVMANENILEQAQKIGQHMYRSLSKIAATTGCLTGVRSVGAMVAADFVNVDNPYPSRLGYQFYKEALKRGALLRPLGNTLYWLPPLNTSLDTLDHLAEITLESIKALYRGEN